MSMPFPRIFWKKTNFFKNPKKLFWIFLFPIFFNGPFWVLIFKLQKSNYISWIDNKIVVPSRGIAFLQDEGDQRYDLSKPGKKSWFFSRKFWETALTFLLLLRTFFISQSHNAPQKNSENLSFPTRYIATLYDPQERRQSKKKMAQYW